MKLFIGVLYTLLPEIILLIGATLLAGFATDFPASGILAVELVTLFLLLATLAMSLQFNRRRMFFALLSILIAYGGLLSLSGEQSVISRQILGGALCLLLPLNLLWIQALTERGIFTRYGAWPFGLLAIEILFVAAIMGAQAREVGSALNVEFVNWPLLAATRISQPGLLLLAAGLLWLNDRLITRGHSPELAAFFFSLVAAAVMLHTQQVGTVAAFAVATALAFGTAITLESWNMAYLDELTGLPGRRALEEQMRQLGNRYVIAMVDVDHFKHFNDSYGHEVGDQVLRLVASRLQKSAAGGKPFRYGGEEFALLYPARTQQEVATMLESLRSDIETAGFNPRRGERRSDPEIAADSDTDEPLRVTVSVGAAESSGLCRDPWSVLKTADQALYRAKQNGRNQVCLART